MTNVVYAKPIIEKVAGFKESTKGLWFGSARDIYGAKTYVFIW